MICEDAEVGKSYYTYYFDTTNKRNKIVDYAGVFKVKLLEISKYGDCKWEISECKKLGKNLSYSIHYNKIYYIFNTKEECIKAHDEAIIKFSKDQTTKDTVLILNKLIDKNSIPKKLKIEIDSIEWYKSLSKKEQEMVVWLKHYCDNI